MDRTLRRLIAALLVGVLVYGVFAVVVGISDLGDALSSFAWSSFGLALGLSSLNYVLRFGKWVYYLRLLGVRKIPVFDNFLVFLSGFVLTVTPGKVGEVFKSAVLARTHGVDPAVTAPIVIGERLTDVIAIVLLVLVGGSALPGGLVWALLGASAVVAGLVVILWEVPLSALVRKLEARGGRMAELVPRLVTARSSLVVVASPRALVFPTLLSVVGWAGEGYGLFLLLDGFGQDVPLLLAFFTYATATLAGALVPVPGGLGVAETILHSGLVTLGKVPLGAATGAMFLCRLATLWWAVVVGFLALGLLRLRFPAALSSQPASEG